MTTEVVSWTTNGYIAAVTLTLPSQTTPFTPAPTCTGTVWCDCKSKDMATIAYLNKWDWVDLSHNPPFDKDCYPGDYAGIFLSRGNWGPPHCPKTAAKMLTSHSRRSFDSGVSRHSVPYRLDGSLYTNSGHLWLAVATPADMVLSGNFVHLRAHSAELL